MVEFGEAFKKKKPKQVIPVNPVTQLLNNKQKFQATPTTQNIPLKESDTKGGKKIKEPVGVFKDVKTGKQSGVQLPDGRVFLGLNKEDVNQIVSAQTGENVLPQGAEFINDRASLMQQQQVQEVGEAQRLQELQNMGVGERASSMKGISTETGLLGDNRPGDFYAGAMDTLSKIFRTEAAGQSLRDAFGANINQKQLEAIKQMNPQDADEYVRRIQEIAIKKNNRKLGTKISDSTAGIVEGLPIVGWVGSYAHIQTPSKQIKTISGVVGGYESQGDKLGIAGKTDPIGSIQNINQQIEVLESYEAELQYLVLRSAEYQASGEAQAIAVRIDTVKKNLINKRDEIAAQYLYQTDTSTSTQRQQMLEELDEAISTIPKDL